MVTTNHWKIVPLGYLRQLSPRQSQGSITPILLLNLWNFPSSKATLILLKFQAKEFNNLLKDWILLLKEKKLKSNSILTKLHAVELFLLVNEVSFNPKILHKLVPPDDEIGGGSIPFTRQEIQKMLESTNKPRTKALLHFFASTGAIRYR